MTKSYHIITIGCQMNKSDSERIAYYLESYGFEYQKERKKAGVVIINTCGIRQRAEDRNYGLIPRIKKENPKTKIILAGCLSERKDVKRRLDKGVDIWLPIRDLPNLYKELGLKEQKFITKKYLSITPKPKSNFSIFIPIGNGCDNFCSYCVVPYARGREVYRSAYEVIKETENFVKNNYKEIILIAQNVNSYFSAVTKRDLKYFKDKKIGDNINFFELLNVVGNIKGNFWVRFSTSHPKDMNEELIITIAENNKLCNHIHLPAQSGDTKILKLMNRKYTIKHYLSLIKKIKNKLPNSSITTDIIVGFPGETKAQFNNTAKLFREVGFDMAYVSRYSVRPNTQASKMKDNVSREEKARRDNLLMAIIAKTSYKNNKFFLGKTSLILIEGRHKSGNWYGKNEQSKVVMIKESESVKNILGKFILVKITGAKNFGLSAEFLKEDEKNK